MNVNTFFTVMQNRKMIKLELIFAENTKTELYIYEPAI